MNCTDTIPYSSELLTGLGPVGHGLVISTGVSTLLNLIISLITLRCLYINVQRNDKRYLSYWLVSICPVVGVTSFAGIISPRSVHINELVSAIYLSVSVVVFFRLILLHHGGEKALCQNLKGAKWPLSKPPFCCCICLRNVYLNRRTLGRIKLMVYQTLVARPVLLYIDAIITSEEHAVEAALSRKPVKTLVSVLNVISTILGFFGLMSTLRLSIQPLRPTGILPKFVYFKLILLFCDPQAMIVNLIVTAGALPCSDLFYHPVRGETLKFVLLCFEMLLLSVFGRVQFGSERPVSDSQMLETRCSAHENKVRVPETKDPTVDSNGSAFETKDPTVDSNGSTFESKDPTADSKGSTFETKGSKSNTNSQILETTNELKQETNFTDSTRV